MFIWTLLPRVATSFKMRVAPRNHFFFFFFFFFEIHMNSSFYWKSHCLSDLWHSCGMTSLIVGSVRARWLAVTTPIPSPPRNYGNGPLIWQLQRQQHLIQMSSSLKPFHDFRVSTQSSSLHSPAACQYICSTATRFVVNFSFEKKKKKRKRKRKRKRKEITFSARLGFCPNLKTDSFPHRNGRNRPFCLCNHEWWENLHWFWTFPNLPRNDGWDCYTKPSQKGPEGNFLTVIYFSAD